MLLPIELIEQLKVLNYKTMVAIAPGSVWKTKIYPQDYFEEVIKYLVDNNIFVILIGGSDDEKLCRGIEEKFDVR